MPLPLLSSEAVRLPFSAPPPLRPNRGSLFRSLLNSSPWKRLGLLVSLLAGSIGGAQAQSVASYTPTRTTGITYSTIVGGGGTSSFTGWRNGNDTDDNLSGATAIGFPFIYDGVAYNQFSVSTNGFLTFNTGTGAIGSGTGAYGYDNGQFSVAGSTVLALAPLYDDLSTATNAATITDLNNSYKYQTSGTTPNRILTVEWVAAKAIGITSALSFQVKLYEVDSHIEYVYGTTSAASNLNYSLGINGPAGGTTAAQLLTQQTVNTATFSNAAKNNLTTIPATNTQLTFTPVATLPAAPTTLTFVSGYTSLKVGFTDNSTNETNFNVFVSPSGAAGTYVAAGAITSTTVAATGGLYSVTLTGLTAGTTYFVQVVANTVGRKSTALSGSGATLSLPVTPLSGTYTINNTLATGGTNFTSFSDAFAALNAVGVSAAVTMNVSAAQTFTERPAVLGTTTLNASLGSSNTLTFVKSGGGANPIVSAPAGVGSMDAIIALSGTDYVTFNAIDLSDPTTNTTATTAAEFGYALFRASVTDGTQHTLIKNCSITLQRARATTVGTLNMPIGIYSASTTAASASLLVATSAAGTNSTNQFITNTIQNVVTGICLVGSAAASPYTFYDQNNEVGSSALGTGNTINNFNGTASIISSGIQADYQNGLLVSRNSLSNATGGGASAVGTLNGIYFAAGAAGTYTVSNNALVLRGAASGFQLAGINSEFGVTGLALTMNNNAFSLRDDGGFMNHYCMYVQDALTSLTVNTNTLSSSTNLLTGGQIGFLITDNATPSISFQNNTISGVTTGPDALFFGYYNDSAPLAGTATITGNTFSTITMSGAATFLGISHTSSLDPTTTATISGNSLTGINVGTTSGNSVAGMQISNGNAASLVTGNTIGDLTGDLVTGFVVLDGEVNTLTRNKIYGLTGSRASSLIDGIYASAGTTLVLENNIIGDFKLTAAATTAGNGLTMSGINIPAFGVTNARLYNNTVNLAVTGGGVRFNATGIYLGSDVLADLRNNLIVNTSTVGTNGGARMSALRSDGALLLSVYSDYNLYYAGTPGTKQLIFYNESTATGPQTLTAYKTLVTPAEPNSKTETAVPFASVTGNTSNFLHITPTTATRVESGGVAITGLTDDFDATGVRGPYPLGGQANGGGSAPDIGADEGDFTPLATIDVGALSMSFPNPSQTCFTSTEPVKVLVKNYGPTPLVLSGSTILTISGAVTGPNPQSFGPTNVTSGTIPANGTLEVVFSSSYDMSALGTYVFTATASVTGDVNSFNAALSPLATFIVGPENQTPTQSGITAVANICPGLPYTIAVTGGGISSGTVSGTRTESPALAIPDNDATAGASSTITLSGAGAATISGSSVVKVTLNLTHTYDDDLDIFLVGPGGCGALLLSSDNGNSGGANYTNTILNTGATNIIGSTGNNAAPFTGIYAPEGTVGTAPDRTDASTVGSTPSGTYNAVIPAGALSGCPINGTWTLKVFDDAGIDVGTINSWALSINDPAIAPLYTHTITGPGTVSAVTYSGAGNATGTVTVTGAPVGANVYTLTTYQSGNCPRVSTVTVTVDPTPTFSSAVGTNVTCNGAANGQITFSGVTGGSGFTYLYSTTGAGGPFTTSATNPITGLAPATYTVKVVNAATCESTTATVVITQPTVISFSATPVTTCTGGSTGIITVAATGGTGTLEYSKDNGMTYQLSNVFTGLSAASYQIVVRDANLCTTAPQTTTVGSTSTVTWTGVVSNNWFSAGNWFPTCVPDASLDAVISSGTPQIGGALAQVHNLSISGAGVLTINTGGDLEVSGTFTTASSSSFTALAGVTTFLGTGAQPIPAASYFGLAVSGATPKVLSGSVTIASTLDVSAGMLRLGNFNASLADNQVVSGAGPSHFVVTDGSGVLTFKSVGGGESALFPIGSTATSTDYTPATLTNNGTSDDFSGTVNDVVPIVLPYDPTGQHVLQKTWDISEATPGGSSAFLTLGWNTANEGAAFDRTRCGVAHFTGGIWEHYLRDFAAATNLGGGRWERTRINNLTSFSPFTVQDDTQPLPVELAAFTADRQGANAVLRWTTASEKNNRGFGVEVAAAHAPDAWRELGFVTSQQTTSNTPSHYSFTDKTPGKNGGFLYRLRQQDLDGTIVYSPVRSLDFGTPHTTAVTAAPNPFRTALEVRVVATVAGPAQLSLIDALGRTVLQQQLPVAAGENRLTPAIPADLPAGTYILTTSVENQLFHVRLVKD
jgi:subtilisin-like proprotein convertase family protein